MTLAQFCAMDTTNGETYDMSNQQANNTVQPQPVTSVAGAPLPVTPQAAPAVGGDYLQQVNGMLQAQTREQYAHTQTQTQELKKCVEDANSRDWTDYAFTAGAALGTAGLVMIGNYILSE